MEIKLDNIKKKLPEYKKKIESLKDMVLANLVMISEIPAPTFNEHKRVDFLVDRFSEEHLHNCSTDEMGNALGILQGTTGDKNILIVAHIDTFFDHNVDHSIYLKTNRVKGPGVGDNGLGLAVLASLPQILKKLNIKFNANLILMGSSQSMGKGDLKGIRFFLNNTKYPISAGICVEGVKLGRLSYSSIGMARCEVRCKVPEEYDWSKFEAVGAIVTINEVINRILEIPLPNRPKTSIVLGSLEGGKSFNKIATEARLRIEIRSESGKMVNKLKRQLKNIAAEVLSHSGAELKVEIVAERKPGGISFSHPMSVTAREIMSELDIKPRIAPSTSELSAFIDKKIPALTIGLTNGENMGLDEETIEIDPIFRGITQLIGLLSAIDKGCCHES